MRVTSSAYAVETSIRDLQQRRDAMTTTQMQISTGRRVVKPGDDPVAAADAERMRGQLSRIELETRVLGFARNNLGIADGALSDASNLLQSARETIVAAGNGSYSTRERSLLAEQIRQTRAQLLMVANRPDGTGGYVWGGQGSNVPPFADGAPPTYLPSPGEQRVGPGAGLSTSLDGRAAFTGQAGTPPQNVFQVLDDAVALLSDPAATPAALAAGISAGLSGVDVGLNALQAQRTQVGEQLRAVDMREESLAAGKLSATGYLAELTEVDLAEALSTLSTQQTALNAAMQTYAQVARMSLFQYL